jgi:hypothetical protein
MVQGDVRRLGVEVGERGVSLKVAVVDFELDD